MLEADRCDGFCYVENNLAEFRKSWKTRLIVAHETDLFTHNDPVSSL